MTTLQSNLTVIVLNHTEVLPDHFEHRLSKLEQSQLLQIIPKIQYTENEIDKCHVKKNFYIYIYDSFKI